MIQGQTLNAAFGFSFDNKYRSLSDKMRDKRRAELQNLKLVIIDEVSMVKADMLYMLDLRLQEITQKEIPFGGIGVICFGDLMQLRPIQGKFIFEEPKNTADFSEAHLLDPRWRMFDSVILEKNHRQGADGAYADLLNKIRIGAQTDEDLAPLMERVRPLGHKDLEDVEVWISGKRDTCAKLNQKFMSKISGSNIAILKAIHVNGNKNFQPKLDTRDNAVATTGFIDSIPIKIGARVMLIHNIDTLDGMTNGQLGSIVDVIKTTKGMVDKLVIMPQDSTIGKRNKSKFPMLASKYPDCIFIERASRTYSLRKNANDDGGSTATVKQFPIKLAFCITAHKIQGRD